jgi:hypothetical protein
LEKDGFIFVKENISENKFVLDKVMNVDVNINIG